MKLPGKQTSSVDTCTHSFRTIDWGAVPAPPATPIVLRPQNEIVGLVFTSSELKIDSTTIILVRIVLNNFSIIFQQFFNNFSLKNFLDCYWLCCFLCFGHSLYLRCIEKTFSRCKNMEFFIFFKKHCKQQSMRDVRSSPSNPMRQRSNDGMCIHFF